MSTDAQQFITNPDQFLNDNPPPTAEQQQPAPPAQVQQQPPVEQPEQTAPAINEQSLTEDEQRVAAKHELLYNRMGDLLVEKRQHLARIREIEQQLAGLEQTLDQGNEVVGFTAQ